MSSPVAALNNIDQLFFSSSVNSSPVNYLSLCRLCLVHLLFHNHHRCITIHNPPAAIIICSPTDRPNAPNSRTHLSFASQRQLKPPFGVLRESPVACSGTSNNASRQEIEESIEVAGDWGSEKVTVHRVIYVNYANCKELSSTRHQHFTHSGRR